MPSAESTLGRGDLAGVNLGQGLVWLAHRNVNLMLEAAYSFQELAAARGTVRAESFLVSPGLRGAIDFPFGLQAVLGAALPIGFGPSSGERGLIAYLSLEHAVTRNPW